MVTINGDNSMGTMVSNTVTVYGPTVTIASARNKDGDYGHTVTIAMATMVTFARVHIVIMDLQ